MREMRQRGSCKGLPINVDEQEENDGCERNVSVLRRALSNSEVATSTITSIDLGYHRLGGKESGDVGG